VGATKGCPSRGYLRKSESKRRVQYPLSVKTGRTVLKKATTRQKPGEQAQKKRTRSGTLLTPKPFGFPKPERF
jgi:hypothetical protein